MKYVTPTKTIGKKAKAMFKEIFPDCARIGKHGRNNMHRFYNFYNANNECIGYYTNQNVDKGYFVRTK